MGLRRFLLKPGVLHHFVCGYCISLRFERTRDPQILPGLTSIAQRVDLPGVPTQQPIKAV